MSRQSLPERQFWNDRRGRIQDLSMDLILTLRRAGPVVELRVLQKGPVENQQANLRNSRNSRETSRLGSRAIQYFKLGKL